MSRFMAGCYVVSLERGEKIDSKTVLFAPYKSMFYFSRWGYTVFWRCEESHRKPTRMHTEGSWGSQLGPWRSEAAMLPPLCNPLQALHIGILFFAYPSLFKSGLIITFARNQLASDSSTILPSPTFWLPKIWKTHYPSIHFLYLILHKLTWNLEPIPRKSGHKAGTLWMRYEALAGHNHIHGQFYFLQSTWRKPPKQGGEHTNSMHTVRNWTSKPGGARFCQTGRPPLPTTNANIVDKLIYK